ncbi:hypothetical protein Dester_1202 [Desulfurobacterium thermolithotrophum DSM 11699]|uniref:Uncharacterized protein n=1 Tax=Desulfurobacterium thermolithotrophum (strain DSM 11699 / BSA) TaxID=868864 RepID=F0S0N5_DESTD|nr:hypothetical protein [Desulfurobacterium thermolithotrophum]ADY73838.1 hypothetical protein Dester_1202 [Desulfurobacterium thermolithotrophum DSM 11699]
MKIDNRAIKGLAYRAADLWLNLELSKFRPDGNYEQVENFLKQRFKADELNPLLVTLGLLEMALIEDALKNKPYLSEEEREKIIQEIVESLAKKFPQIVSEMEKILSEIDSKIKEFKLLADKYRKGGE